MSKLKSLKNRIVREMYEQGYSLSDLLDAYPNCSLKYLDEMLADSSYGQSRPVISYGLLSIYPCKSKYFNISKYRFRINGKMQPWPPERDKISIFFFGGSAALGINIEDKHTIPARLQTILEKIYPCEVYNFACSSYTLRHEMLRFLDIIDQKIIPDYVVFLDGYNDCYETLNNRVLINALDLYYQTQKKRYKKLKHWKTLFDSILFHFIDNKRFKLDQFIDIWESSPLDIIKNNKNIYLSNNFINISLKKDGLQNIAKYVWQRYLDSVLIIRSICNAKKIKNLFVWQPVPLYKTRKEHRLMEKLYYIYPYGTITQPVYSWIINNNFPGLNTFSDFLDISMIAKEIENVCYVDTAHYSPEFCNIIAKKISQKLIKIGLN